LTLPRRSLALAAAVALAAVAGALLRGSHANRGDASQARPSVANRGSTGASSEGASGPFELPAEASGDACSACHAAQARAWSASQHAHAMRRFDAARDPMPPDAPASPVAWIGVAPLAHALVPGARGRLQVFDPAWDSAHESWFSIFGDAPPAPHEWGH
jgi:hypothetical protein